MNMECQPRDARGDRRLGSEGAFFKSLEAQSSFDGIYFSNLRCVRNKGDSPNVGPKVLKNAKPSLSRLLNSCNLWHRGENYFSPPIMSLVPCLTDHASSRCI